MGGRYNRHVEVIKKEVPSMTKESILGSIVSEISIKDHGSPRGIEISYAAFRGTPYREKFSYEIDYHEIDFEDSYTSSRKIIACMKAGVNEYIRELAAKAETDVNLKIFLADLLIKHAERIRFIL